MRAGQSSRFAVISMLVLLAMAVGCNLYISNARIHNLGIIRPSDPKTRLLLSDGQDSIEGTGWWPSVPKGIPDLGQPFLWNRVEQPGRRFYLMFFRDPVDQTSQSLNELLVITTGWPCITVEHKRVIHVMSKQVVWPTDAEYRVIYHPLGLILNPIIYALPVWLVLMGVRWLLVSSRRRRRASRGLCVRCAYTLDGLSVCPECGREI